MTKERIKYIFIILIIFSIVLIVLLAPYIHAEFLTRRYGDEFIGLEQQTGMLKEPLYLRVMSYNGNCAKVYYVYEHGAGYLINFHKDDNSDWIIESWKSVSGSIDDLIWPYYR